MELEFIKMQLAGRDMILVDAARHPSLGDGFLAAGAGAALDRRRGVGADALVLVTSDPEHELEVRCFTARGVEEEPTLHELICAGRYGIDSGLASGTTTRARGKLRSVVLDALDSRSLLADVGVPLREDARELVESPDIAYTRTARLDGRDFTYTPLYVGPFQAVTFVPSFDIDIPRLSKAFRREVLIPAGPSEASLPDPAQLTYARVSSRRRLLTRTWRFGHGETQSEGYAAAAAAVAATLHGFTDRDSIVAARGGELYVTWSEANNRLYVTGTPEYVFTGTYSMSERREGGQAV